MLAASSSQLSTDVHRKRLQNSFHKLKSGSEKIRTLISNKKDIEEDYKKWLNSYETFLDLNQETKDKDEYKVQYDEWDVYLSNFKKEVEGWCLFKATERGKQPTAKTGTRSLKSSMSSVYLKQLHEKLESQAVKEAAARKNQLKLELEQQEKIIDLETRLTIAEGKVQIYEDQLTDIESISQDSEAESMPMQELPVSPSQEPPVSPSQELPVSPSPAKRDDPIQHLSEILTRRMDRDALPKPEPEIFRGDTFKYPLWMNSFKRFIEDRTEDPTERLFYLGRYTDGEVKNSISGLLAVNTAEAYTNAMKLIKDRFGDPFLAAQEIREKIKNWPKVNNDSKALLELADFLQQCKTAMTVSTYLNVLNDPHENKKILEKLPLRIVGKWSKIVDDWLYNKPNLGQFPPFTEFCEFLSRESRIANNPITQVITKTREDHVKPVKYHKPYQKKSGYTTSSFKAESMEKRTSEDQDTCSYCNEINHKINECKKFTSIDLKERKEFIKTQRLCWGCLLPGHRSKECRVKKRCSRCQGRHPTSIHDETYVKKEIAVNSCTADLPSLTHSLIVPVWLYHEEAKSKRILTYALLDDQSDGSFIKTSVAEKINAKGYPVKLSLSTILGKAEVDCKKVHQLSIQGVYENKEIHLPVLYTRDIIPASRNQIPKNYTIERWSHLKKISKSIMPYREDVEVGLLIGVNCIQALKPIEIIPGNEDHPYGIRTHLGWGVIGTMTTDEFVNDEYHVNRISIEMAMERMYNMDFADKDLNARPYSYNDTRFMKKVTEGISLDNGHFKLPLPLKEEKPMLPFNREMAVRRLYSQRARLQRDQLYRHTYEDYMLKLLENKHAELVPATEIKNEPSWYIPHHGVTHPKKPEKLRVVFDCSAKFQNTCLNSMLLQGPDLTNNLVGVLCRFRQERYAFVCDIEGMFHQVMVDESHRDLLRFVWWKDSNLTTIADYRMNVHLFGATSSPGCANFALKQTAKQFKEKYGWDAANFVLHDFYVDDGLKSVASTEKAITLIKDSQSLCREGGFRLHKFLSNSKTVIDSIPRSQRAQSIKDFDISKDVLPIERTLGVQWCVEADAFQFKIDLKDCPLTRRGILSTVSSVFDPLGLVCPVILIGKRILQDLCRDKFDWDDDIPEELRYRWEKWRKDLHLLAEKKIDRCYKPEEFGTLKSVQLHNFSDASLTGYGECSYLRLIDETGKIHCTLVMAKARVTPLKQITVPRLELGAAVVSTQISAVLQKELEYDNIEEYFWTDSNVVLGYINNDARRFHIFVANRVQQIRNYTEPNQWCKIDTSINPADYASRGLQTSEIISKKLWWNGPELLWHEFDAESYKSICPSLKDNDPEVKAKVLAVKEFQVTYPSLIERMEYYSSWYKARHSVAICMKYINVLQRKKEVTHTHEDKLKLTVEDLTKAEIVILRHQQAISFNEDISILKSQNEQKLPKRSTIYKLDPFIDTNGLLRVGGRIKNSDLSYDLVHPLILPKKSHITNLIIHHYHSRSNHQGRGMTHNEIRSSGYWIISGKSSISEFISRCTKCIKTRASPQVQKMADLPADRLSSEAPFTYSAVDLFGPFYIKERRSELKRYGVLFTCLSSRAIHLEIANSLETDSFLNAYRRFVCRRGPIRHLRSDQGTNFVGAKNELEKLDQSIIHKELLKEQCDFVEFKFNTPKSSHMGGVWERLIRSVRSVLNSLLLKNGTQLDDESLRTLMTEAEAIVNCRPLTEVTDLNEPLTPNQILTLKSKTILPPPGEFSPTDLYSKKRWRRVQHLASEFWNRWRKEYIQTLQCRQKWIHPQRNLKIDDIVIIKDDQKPRNKWSLARVVETYPEKDNLVRKVKILVADGNVNKNGKRLSPTSYLERPIHSLVLLVPNEV